jgi:isoamylase
VCACLPLKTPFSSFYPSFSHQNAVNFAVTSSGASVITLCLFTRADLDAGTTTHEFDLDPAANRTGDTWHVLLPGIPDLGALLYGYRARGPHQDDVAEDMAGWESVGGENGGRDPASNPAAGHRFDGAAVLVDPYARAVIGRRTYGVLGPDLAYGTPGVAGVARTWPQAAGALPHPAIDAYDWEGDTPLRLPAADLVIYEMHVRGFTAHPSSGLGPGRRGTFAGVVDKLDYLAGLGVNAVELLPVHEFNELEYAALPPGHAGGAPPPGARLNYWGYSTVNFFSPMARYASSSSGGGGGDGSASASPPPSSPAEGAAIINEFRDLVKACHARGIEVILDVVFNHTAEGNERGPAISFRGLDNRAYYMLAPAGQYYNYSGCGNTLNCNHPAVVAMIVASLRYWVTEMHVDGFRFDLASILTRAHSAWAAADLLPDGRRAPPLAGDGAPLISASGALLTHGGGMSDGAGVPTGTPLADPPLVAAIAEDPVLRNTKLIAEAWDCDGLNQVGAFPHYGGRFAEWNGHFRDTVRQFVKGTEGPWAPAFAAALCGSPSIYAAPAGEGDWWGSGPGARWRGGRGPTASINFVTAHDGFTLADLVAYNEKHNDANGEGGADGEAHNLSWNCGEEGPTADGGVARLRARQVRNLAAALLLAQGVPMLHMGDEYGHTKAGNNNTYCHDSPLNWFDWGAAGADAGGTLRFTRALLRLRRAHPELRRDAYIQDGEVEWHGTAVGEPDWSEASRLVALSLRGRDGGGLYLAWSAAHTPAVLALPDWAGREWRPVIDTGKPAPYDALVVDDALSADAVAGAVAQAAGWTREGAYPLLPWACVVLESVPAGAGAERFHGLDSMAASVSGGPGPATPATSNAPPGRGMTPAERDAYAAAAAENARLRAALAEVEQAGGGGVEE